MNREWLPILWILAGIFFLITLLSLWNRRDSQSRRQQAIQDREAICQRLVASAPRHEISLDMDTCMRLLEGVPAGRRNAYRACLEREESAGCLFDALCRDVRGSACAWARAVAWENPEDRAAAQERLVRMCENDGDAEACGQLLRISRQHPGVGLAAPSYWQTRICRITGRFCSGVQTALADCLKNPAAFRCLGRLDARPDPVAYFLACQALSGSACRRWAQAVFPHTKNPEDPYWSDARLSHLCTLGDSESCARLGQRRNLPDLLLLACREGYPDACVWQAEVERDPVRAAFLQWRGRHPVSPGL